MKYSSKTNQQNLFKILVGSFIGLFLTILFSSVFIKNKNSQIIIPNISPKQDASTEDRDIFPKDDTSSVIKYQNNAQKNYDSIVFSSDQIDGWQKRTFFPSKSLAISFKEFTLHFPSNWMLETSFGDEKFDYLILTLNNGRSIINIRQIESGAGPCVYDSDYIAPNSMANNYDLIKEIKKSTEEWRIGKIDTSPEYVDVCKKVEKINFQGYSQFTSIGLISLKNPTNSQEDLDNFIKMIEVLEINN